VVLDKLGRWLDAMAATDSMPGMVAIADNGKIVFSRVAGIADERTKAPNTPDTRFTLASLGKMFAAVSVAQLVEQDKVALADTVGKFLPDFPNRDVRRVTVHQLLTHTSGLGLYWNDRYVARRASLYTLADYVPLFADDTLLFAPGSRFGYSNNGYIVLGRIVEAASGMSYYDYVKRNVFDRAGMPNTGHYDRSGGTPNGAVGYSRDASGALQDNLGLRELRGSSAGGGYSTAADLVTFMDAIAGGRLIRAETREQFIEGRSDGPFGPRSYGYGFMLRLRQGKLLSYGHTGGFSGMTAQAFHYPGSGRTLVVLLNRSGPVAAAVMSESTRALAAMSGP
jgi:CubicO group peptidase (beta-lactamase class C family)